MPTAVGQTKDGRSSYRLGRDKTALSILLSESTRLAAIGRRMRGVVTPCGLRLASVVNYNENRQCEPQKVTRCAAECGAAWVAKSECCQL